MRPLWETVPGVPGAVLVSVLDASDCVALIRATQNAYAPKRSRRPGPPIRTNERTLHTPDPALLQKLDGALRPLFTEQGVCQVEAGWVPAKDFVNPKWRMNRYTPNQAFFPHFDSGHAFAANRRSLYSVIVYLDADFEGGDTVFFPGGHRRDGMPAEVQDAEEVVVKARPGWALVFPHYGPRNPRHEGREVTSGCKHIGRTDLVFEAPITPLRQQIFGPDTRIAVLLLGRQGSGKTTLAPALAQRLHAHPLAFGSEVRRHRTEGTPLGLRLREAKGTPPGEPRRPGGFLADALAAEVVDSAMPSTPTVVFDGYPRTRTQSLRFETRNWQTLALHLTSTQRISRLQDRGRAGDDAASQGARETDWRVHTEPLIAHYEKRGELIRVDGDGPPERVADRAAHGVWNALLDRWRAHLPSGMPWDGPCDGRDHSANPRTRVFDLGDRFLKFSLDPLRTQWRGPLPTAKVLASTQHDDLHVAVLERLPGRSLKDLAPTASDAEKQRWCEQLAQVLRKTHTPAAQGPDLWAQAASVVDTVPLSNFSPRYGTTPPRSREELRARLHRLTDPGDPHVHLHGDPCLPNWMVEDGKISGTLDLTHPATGPAGWDVALAAWSVGYNFGVQWSGVFETAYGFEGDLELYRELVRFLA